MIQSVKEFLESEEFYSVSNDFDTHQAMIEFAKLHVQEALKQAAENAELESYGKFGCSINKESILNSYPLGNIK
jgi:hypothetical protein